MKGAWDSVFGRFLRPALPMAAILVLGALIYSNSVGVPFVFDDRTSILENPAVRDWTEVATLWRSNPNRFILYLSLALNYRAGGVDVRGYHLANLCIHLGAALLVFGLVRLICTSPWARLRSPEALRDGSLIAFFSALLFVAHPIQTQAVTYIVQRAESLATFFYLLAVVLYGKGRQSSFSSKRLSAFRFLLSAWLSAALGMLTKETVASLPLALLLYELCFLRPSALGLVAAERGADAAPLACSSAPPLFRSLAPLFPFFLLPLFALWLSTGAELDLPAQTGALSRSSYLVTQARVLVTYWRLLLLPIGQNLDYDFPSSHSLGDAAVLASAILLASLLALAAWAFRRQRILSFSVLWFFVTLSVTSSMIPILDVIYEHRLYPAVLGYGLALSWIVLRAGEWRSGGAEEPGSGGARGQGSQGAEHSASGAASAPPSGARNRRAGGLGGLGGRGIALALLCLIVAAYALAAHQRNRVWQDEVSLWRDSVAKSPGKARPHNNLGLALTEAGAHEEAVEVLRRAIRLRPNYAEAHNNLGLALTAAGAFGEAVEMLKVAIRLRPNYPEAHNNLGLALTEAGAHEEAVAVLRRAIQLRPGYAEAHNNLGLAYRASGWDEQALHEYRRALELDPRLADAHINLGVLYGERGRNAEARQEFALALSLDPGNVEVHNNLGNLYLSEGRYLLALAEYQKALASNPLHRVARSNLGALWLKTGQPWRAIEEYQVLLSQEPADLLARSNLGFAYYHGGELDRAIEEQKKVVTQDAGFANGYYGLALAYEKKGMVREAADAWEEYLRRAPADEPWVPQARKHLRALQAAQGK